MAKFKEFVGTPEYMSPEAINNKDATYRADLWSLGCFIYMLLTGNPAFKGVRRADGGDGADRADRAGGWWW